MGNADFDGRKYLKQRYVEYGHKQYDGPRQNREILKYYCHFCSAMRRMLTISRECFEGGFQGKISREDFKGWLRFSVNQGVK